MQEALTSAVTHCSVGPLIPLLLRQVSQQFAEELVQEAASRQSIIALHGVSRDTLFSMHALHGIAPVAV
jgi:hypothetical protein